MSRQARSGDSWYCPSAIESPSRSDRGPSSIPHITITLPSSSSTRSYHPLLLFTRRPPRSPNLDHHVSQRLYCSRSPSCTQVKRVRESVVPHRTIKRGVIIVSCRTTVLCTWWHITGRIGTRIAPVSEKFPFSFPPLTIHLTASKFIHPTPLPIHYPLPYRLTVLWRQNLQYLPHHTIPTTSSSDLTAIDLPPPPLFSSSHALNVAPHSGSDIATLSSLIPLTYSQ